MIRSLHCVKCGFIQHVCGYFEEMLTCPECGFPMVSLRNLPFFDCLISISLEDPSEEDRLPYPEDDD